MANRRERYQPRQYEDDYSTRSSQPEQYQPSDYSQQGEGDIRYREDSARYSQRGAPERARSYSGADNYDPLADYEREYSRDASYRQANRGHSYFRGDEYGGESYNYGRSDNYRGGYGGYGNRDHNVYARGGGYRDDYDRDRGFFDRAGDEVASWFGDDEAARRREMDHRGRGPANYSRSDEKLLEDACERLTSDRYVDARKINVAAQDNEITLDGTVDSRAAKRRAEDCVHDISGVRHVQNNLRIDRDDDTSWTSRNEESDRA